MKRNLKLDIHVINVQVSTEVSLSFEEGGFMAEKAGTPITHTGLKT